MAAFDITKEDGALNQYWYDQGTIDALVGEIQMHGSKVAFLSTPSLYFALTDAGVKANSKVFEFDKQWETDAGFVFYDFNKPEQVPAHLWEAFDYIVVDPPFITQEVWAKYAATVKLIASKDAKFLFTSVIENHKMLEEVVDKELYVPAFRPGIPHLTYQYHCFTSYQSGHHLAAPNPSLPAEDASVVAARNMSNDMRESQQQFAQQMHTRDRGGEQVLPAQRAPEEQARVDNSIMKWTHVPAGLTEYAGGAEAPAAEQEVELPAEYHRLVARRASMETAKKTIDQVTRAVDAAVKATEKNEDEKVAASLAQRDELLASITAIAEQLAGEENGNADGVAILLKSFVSTWGQEVPEKQTYKEMSADATRKFKSPIFNQQKALLQEMKKVKKAAADAAKAE